MREITRRIFISGTTVTSYVRFSSIEIFRWWTGLGLGFYRLFSASLEIRLEVCWFDVWQIDVFKSVEQPIESWTYRTQCWTRARSWLWCAVRISLMQVAEEPLKTIIHIHMGSDYSILLSTFNVTCTCLCNSSSDWHTCTRFIIFFTIFGASLYIAQCTSLLPHFVISFTFLVSLLLRTSTGRSLDGFQDEKPRASRRSSRVC